MSTPSQTPARSQIVKNSAENFSLYYNTLNFFKTIMKNHPSIAKVTQGDLFAVDTTQFPQYPIGNVMIQTANFSNNIDPETGVLFCDPNIIEIFPCKAKSDVTNFVGNLAATRRRPE